MMMKELLRISILYKPDHTHPLTGRLPKPNPTPHYPHPEEEKNIYIYL